MSEERNIETKKPYVPNQFGRRPPIRKQLHRINDFIRNTPVVRVVGDSIEASIVSIKEALDMAEEQGLDLVEISPTANPPVCKIVDYQKFLYQLKKKQKDAKAKTTKVVVKEVRFGPNTDDHDFNFKLKHAINFLKEGAKVKADVFFKGRSIIYKEHGEDILKRLAEGVEDYGKVEQLPKLEGKRMIMILTPKK